jgi:hypothetical protein
MRQLGATRPSSAAGEVWSLRLSRPAKLFLEDHYVDLRGIPPLLAFSRESVLKTGR